MSLYMEMEKIGPRIRQFLQKESAGGLLLMAAAIAALIVANTPLNRFYEMLITTPVEVRVGALLIDKPLLLWINDGLMVFFFFMVGLELKREVLQGELSSPEKIMLPAVGAIGGIVFPGLIYVLFNYDNELALQGWAIPTATDIAFALGILSLLGSGVPLSVKVFLTSLAIFDDIAAIVIIALFYTANISLLSLLFVVLCLPLLFWLNRYSRGSRFPFVLIGILMWVAMLKSGVHATLTGVILAMFIPIETAGKDSECMLRTMEKSLHTYVGFLVLPIFAFVNAGVTLIGLGLDEVLHTVPVGIATGLLFGKSLGIFGCCVLAAWLGFVKLPRDMTFKALFGTAALCGVGFTMSLFIGSLAFEETGINQLFDERLGIIAGSLISGALGFFILRRCYPKEESAA